MQLCRQFGLVFRAAAFAAAAMDAFLRAARSAIAASRAFAFCSSSRVNVPAGLPSSPMRHARDRLRNIVRESIIVALAAARIQCRAALPAGLPENTHRPEPGGTSQARTSASRLAASDQPSHRR